MTKSRRLIDHLPRSRAAAQKGLLPRVIKVSKPCGPCETAYAAEYLAGGAPCSNDFGPASRKMLGAAAGRARS